MPLPYTVVRIYTSEEARYEGKPLSQAIVNFVHGLKISARCLVNKAAAGCYENGEISTFGVEVLSYNMPLEITVIFPSGEKGAVLPALERMAEDGIMTVEEREVLWHKSRKQLIPRQVKVRDIMTTGPVSVPVSAPAGEIIKILSEAKFHAIPVTAPDGRPAGIVTQGDLLRRAKMPLQIGLLTELAAHHLKALDDTLAGLCAKDLMSSPLVTANEEENLTAAVETMLKNSLKRLPVLDKDGKLTGMVARLDVFKTILDKAPDWQALKRSEVILSNVKTVREAMRQDTPVLPQDAPVWDAVKLIETTDIKRVAVVNGEGKLLGLISDSVLLNAFSEHKAGILDYFVSKLSFTAAGRRNKEFLRALRAKTVGEIMRTDIFSLREDDPIDEAIKLMVAKKLKRVPVLDKGGVFKGMLTRDSILRAGAAK
jgi:CBS domain-containing protein